MLARKGGLGSGGGGDAVTNNSSIKAWVAVGKRLWISEVRCFVKQMCVRQGSIVYP